MWEYIHIYIYICMMSGSSISHGHSKLKKMANCILVAMCVRSKVLLQARALSFFCFWHLCNDLTFQRDALATCKRIRSCDEMHHRYQGILLQTGSGNRNIGWNGVGVTRLFCWPFVQQDSIENHITLPSARVRLQINSFSILNSSSWHLHPDYVRSAWLLKMLQHDGTWSNRKEKFHAAHYAVLRSQALAVSDSRLPDDPGGRLSSQRSSYRCRSSSFLLMVISNYFHRGGGSSPFRGFVMEILWLLWPSHLCPNLSPEARMMLSPQGKMNSCALSFYGFKEKSVLTQKIFRQGNLLRFSLHPSWVVQGVANDSTQKARHNVKKRFPSKNITNEERPNFAKSHLRAHPMPVGLRLIDGSPVCYKGYRPHRGGLMGIAPWQSAMENG